MKIIIVCKEKKMTFTHLHKNDDDDQNDQNDDDMAGHFQHLFKKKMQ